MALQTLMSLDSHFSTLNPRRFLAFVFGVESSRFIGEQCFFSTTVSLACSLWKSGSFRCSVCSGEVRASGTNMKSAFTKLGKMIMCGYVTVSELLLMSRPVILISCHTEWCKMEFYCRLSEHLWNQLSSEREASFLIKSKCCCAAILPLRNALVRKFRREKQEAFGTQCSWPVAVVAAAAHFNGTWNSIMQV